MVKRIRRILKKFSKAAEYLVLYLLREGKQISGEAVKESCEIGSSKKE